MSFEPGFPAIEELLPHRGSMLLLGRIVAADAREIVAAFSPQAGAWYADDAGAMPNWIGIELMAQAIAAHVALLKRGAGVAVKPGVLLGTRKFGAVCDGFLPGVDYRIVAREVLRDSSGMGAYDCRIECADAVVATATLKVFEPEDFELFIKGGKRE